MRLSLMPAAWLLAFAASAAAQPATDLWARGYAVIPTPQRVTLQDGDVAFGSNWKLELLRLDAKHIAARTLLADLAELHGVHLKTSGQGGPVIRLLAQPGTVQTQAEPAIEEQAYRLRMEPGLIEVTGNGDRGLFYGVQTFLQLLKRGPSGELIVPHGTVEDWPKLQLRFLHWDTKHHQDRMETLKRYLDWAARFKINMIGFELEDKFAYPSHPVIGAPGAFTPEQLQEIVNYGLERYIQVVPQIQGPAHMAYVLKHPEFAGLRSDGSNYQICTCDPRALDLIFSMYDDVIKATRGVDYLFVSTDEVYYAGNCAKCERPYNPENRSLAWVDFVNKAHDFLQKRNRKMLIWAEFPLLPQHVKLLPSGIIDGIIGNPAFLPLERERNIRQLAYSATQGAELLFPGYFGLRAGSKGHLETAYENIAHGKHWQGDPIGAFGAAWDDSGLHNETFWLGWAAVAGYAWNPGVPSVGQQVAEFMKIYYGPNVVGMEGIYRLMQSQAQAWERTWDRIPSKVILTRYGSYFGKGIGTHRTDMTLSLPLINDLPDWFPDPAWADRYKMWIDEARSREQENQRLIHELQDNLGRAGRNQYNLELFLALARFMGHHWRLFTGLETAENMIREGQGIALDDRPADAVARLSAAYGLVAGLRREGETTFRQLQTVFEKSRYPKGRSVNGREFVHVFDDVKDHFADRRADLSFMTAPEESLGLDKWCEELARVITLYAQSNGVPVPKFD